MKVLALLLLGLVLALQYRLWIADGGMREVWRLRKEVATQTDVNTQLQERNRTLAAEVTDLKKGKSAIEERARTDLGMVGANETFFQVDDARTANAASKSATPPADAGGSDGNDRNKSPLQVNDVVRSGNRSPLAVQAAK